MTQPPLPLTDRVLARLPGRRVAWIMCWAALPWLNAGANLLLGTERTSPVWEQSDALIVLNYATVSLAIAVSLLGTHRIAQRLAELGAWRGEDRVSAARVQFRGMSSVAGPVVLSSLAALAFGVSSAITDGLAAGALRGATWFTIGVALFTYIWTYGSLLLGLSRLGRERLVLEPVPVDPGLGLQPLGGIASTGLWMLLVWLVPLLVTGLPDVVGAVTGMLVLVLVLSTFFLSLLRLHQQMVAVKHAEIALARALYAQAYGPIHDAPTLELLDEQRGLLAAADALEKRARAIHEWPFAERTPTVVVTVVTSVIAMAIGRLILDPFGL